MEINFVINVQIIGELDETSGKISIKKIIPLITNAEESESINYLVHSISPVENNYGILTLGKNMKKQGLPLGTKISIELDGKKVKEVNTHKTIFGRVDGLKALFNEQLLKTGDIIKVNYDIEEKILHLIHYN